MFFYLSTKDRPLDTSRYVTCLRTQQANLQACSPHYLLNAVTSKVESE